MKKYSTTSQNNLDSADPRLILIFTDALNIMDHSILDGYRTEAEQLAGRTYEKSRGVAK